MMNLARFNRVFVMALFMALLMVLLAACGGGGNEYAAPPAPQVTIANPVTQDVTVYEYFTGQTQSSATVEIRARVSGFLQEIHFRDGQFVKKGQRLYSIDRREYDAALHQAQADLLTAETSLDFAKNDFDRREHAFRENAISELDFLGPRQNLWVENGTISGALPRTPGFSEA